MLDRNQIEFVVGQILKDWDYFTPDQKKLAVSSVRRITPNYQKHFDVYLSNPEEWMDFT